MRSGVAWRGRHAAIVAAGIMAAFAGGVVVGAVGLLTYGETLGSQVIAQGVRIANAGSVPLWRLEAGTALSRQETPVVPVVVPVVARKGK